MNVFHWHLTGLGSSGKPLIQDRPCPKKDHQSFSFETKLSEEVYRHSENFKYSHEDVKEIIEYARVRGIRARLMILNINPQFFIDHDS